jgi:hypothetical protein
VRVHLPLFMNPIRNTVETALRSVFGTDVDLHRQPKAERELRKVDLVTPIAPPLVVQLSNQLRMATRSQQSRIVRELRAAGLDGLHGWTFDQMIRGRLNPDTGDRQYPTGRLNTQRAFVDHSIGVYYGSVSQLPVETLYQTGIIWQSAS